MTIPGFTADESLLRSTGHYSTTRYATLESRAAAILPQQDAECCDISCPGKCICFQGHGTCEVVMKRK